MQRICPDRLYPRHMPGFIESRKLVLMYRLILFANWSNRDRENIWHICRYAFYKWMILGSISYHSFIRDGWGNKKIHLFSNRVFSLHLQSTTIGCSLERWYGQCLTITCGLRLCIIRDLARVVNKCFTDRVHPYVASPVVHFSRTVESTNLVILDTAKSMRASGNPEKYRSRDSWEINRSGMNIGTRDSTSSRHDIGYRRRINHCIPRIFGTVVSSFFCHVSGFRVFISFNLPDTLLLHSNTVILRDGGTARRHGHPSFGSRIAEWLAPLSIEQSFRNHWPYRLVV